MAPQPRRVPRLYGNSSGGTRPGNTRPHISRLQLGQALGPPPYVRHQAAAVAERCRQAALQSPDSRKPVRVLSLPPHIRLPKIFSGTQVLSAIRREAASVLSQGLDLGELLKGLATPVPLIASAQARLRLVRGGGCATIWLHMRDDRACLAPRTAHLPSPGNRQGCEQAHII